MALRSQCQDWTVLLLLHLALVLQFALGLGTQLVYFVCHALRVLRIFVIGELLLREGLSLGPRLKPRK